MKRLLLLTALVLSGCSFMDEFTRPAEEDTQWIASNVSIENIPADEETIVKDIAVTVHNTIDLDKTPLNGNTALKTKLVITMQDGTKDTMSYNSKIEDFLIDFPVQIGDSYSGKYESHEEITFIANKIDTRNGDTIEKHAIVTKSFSEGIEDGTVITGNSSTPESINGGKLITPVIKDEYAKTTESTDKELSFNIETIRTEYTSGVTYNAALKMPMTTRNKRYIHGARRVTVGPEGSFRID